MMNKSLVKGIKQASPIDQTSFLEGFHTVVNQYSPKMNAYSLPGIFCRYNSNQYSTLRRKKPFLRRKKQNADGSQQIKLTYPKFKDGEATVGEVPDKQNFDTFMSLQIARIYQLHSL